MAQKVMISCSETLTISEHAGKMKGIPSISTNCKQNKFCIARIRQGKDEREQAIQAIRNRLKSESGKEPTKKAIREILKSDFNETICVHCYSDSIINYRKRLDETLTVNGEILKNRILTDSEIGQIPVYSKFFRFESFGDIENEIQLLNYVNIAKANPDTKFGLWSKNLRILNQVFLENEKPSNLSVVLSSLKMNEPYNGSFPAWIDHIFTVYSKDYAEKNGVSINCGSRDCLSCNQCYRTDSTFVINEILRADQKKGVKKSLKR